MEGAGTADEQDAGREDAAADDSKEDEAQPEESAEGKDGTEQAPAEEPSEQKEDITEEDKSQPDSAKKDARKADSASDVEFKELTLVVAAVTGKTKSPLNVEYQVKLWTENGEGDVPFANQTLPTGETTDANGVVKKSMQLPAGENSVYATIKVPKGYYFKATLSPDETDEVGLFFSSNNAKASEGISDNTYYYNSIVCNAYVKPEVHIIKEDADGNPLSGAKLQILSSSGEVLDSWTSEDSEHTVRLLPNINNIAGNYYTLVETEAPTGYSRAAAIEFKVFPDPTGVVIDNTQYKDYTIHMVNEKYPGSLRVEMDFDTQNDLIDSDTNAYPFYVTVEIDGLKTTKQYTYHYTYGQYEGNRTVYLGPNNKTFTQQLHSYDYLVLSGLPEGTTYSVSQQTASDNRYEDPVYDSFKTGTIESDQEAKTVITNTARLYTWSLTKQVVGAYNGQEFEFYFHFCDDFFQWGSAPHYYEINGVKHELEVMGHETGAGGTINRTDLGARVYLKNGDTVTVPNIAAAAHYYYAEKADREPGYEGYTSSSGGLIGDYDVLAINVSKMVAIRKLDQYGNHVAGAKLQILGHDHSTVIEEFTTTDEDYFWIPKYNINQGSDQFYLHEVSAPGGYIVSEEDIPFTYKEGERVSYTNWTTGPWSSTNYYQPFNVTVNGKTVENNTIVMTDKATEVTISKTDITGEEEIGGASLAVYKAEDYDDDGVLVEGKEAIDSWTSEEGKSHRIVGILEAGAEFVLIETTAPDGYEKAEAVTFYITSDGRVDTVGGGTVTDSTITMVDEYSTHNVKISKTDVGGKEIAGAEITITGRAKGETKDIDKITYTTDGKAPHEVELKPGTYTMTEVTAPEGYEKAESITFTVEIDGSVLVDGKKVTDATVTMVDEYFTADVKISKTDVGGKEIAGAEITITGRADGESEDIEEITYTTDGKKPHEVELRPGTYTMTEVTAPNGYEKAESITFTVKADGTVLVGGKKVKDSTVTMVDEYSTHVVKISKTDVGGKEIADAEITITGRADGESKDIDKITYTTDGKAPHEVELKPGTYTMTEVTAPEGYKKAESITFTVDKDGVVKVGGKKVTDSTVTMVDEYETFTVKISKTDVGGKEIAGAEITITGRADGESEDIEEIKYTTDGKKPHEVELRPGTYTMTEVTAPNGYEKAESITFTVDKDGVVKVDGKKVKDSTVTMVDEYSTHVVKISKTDVGGKEIADAEITITGCADGETKDIDKITYTTDGKAPHEVELKPGTYTMTEVTAPEGYKKAESITFTVDKDGAVKVGGKKVTDSTVTMVDEYETFTVKISKTDVGGKEIAGAEITITGRADGESEDIKEIKYTTDGKKPHEVELRPGTYTMTEVTAPNGYEKAESITFTVKVDGSVYVNGKKVTDSTVTMVDEYSTHVVKISKTDVGGKEITGAVLTITGREDGASKDIKEIRFTTDGKKPHEFSLKPGTYTLTEITAPNGYEKAESITFTVKTDGTVLVGGKDVKGKVTMVDKAKTTKKTTKTKKSKGGRTGDESGVMLYMTIFAAAAAGLAAVLLRKRRKG